MSTATVTRISPRLDSADPNRVGAHMSSGKQVLDVIEQLFEAARHPDMVAVKRYGPGTGAWGPTVSESKVAAITGIRVYHQSTASASLWDAVWPGAQPVDAPAVTPAPLQNRAPRLLIFTARLLDEARPPMFRSWQLVALPNLGNRDEPNLPFGLQIVTDGGETVLLRATATGPTLGSEPETEPFPDYTIPEGVKDAFVEAVQRG